VNPYLLDKVEQGQLSELEVEVHYSTEWDEFWSYVQKKENQRWTWYIVERSSGRIVGWENGRRQDEVLKTLLARVGGLPIRVCCTDGLGAYHRCLPEEYVHIVGKDKTWKIERKNLNFRTHLKRLNRRTICFSKKEEIHDNVIGMYIEKYYFKTGKFSEAA
jgi:insertion element IS1 protein InsB